MPGHSNNSRPPLPTPHRIFLLYPNTIQRLETFTLFGISCHVALLPISVSCKSFNSPLARSESEADKCRAWLIPDEGDRQYQLASLLMRLRGSKTTSLPPQWLFAQGISICGSESMWRVECEIWILPRQVVGEKDRLIQRIWASLAIRVQEHLGNSGFACGNQKKHHTDKEIPPWSQDFWVGPQSRYFTALYGKREVKMVELMRHGGAGTCRT